ncbi:type 4b pilus protein PilO2 [Limnobacter humi]|uniref:Type 4b pilus protein PilO2 n=1 Tax=Limnobacter humi TaxID=1778671 RepID=A0ABT1WBZ2_9BURK|nr:type 4b pilus protein PilO2 [Limnobacter humi]MCQ8895031.1 type 4b pilus protein PilO2 [Limnobacter humi]
MKDETSAVGQYAKRLLVAGLSWQPVFARRLWGQMAEIRQNALLLDCGLYASVKAGKTVVAGFDNFDESLSKEERNDAPYALAAVLARAFGDTDSLVAWRIRSGDRLGEVALVVIEHGVPTMDVIATESEVLAMMEYYQRSREESQLFRVVSNDTKIWVADVHIEDDSAFIKRHVQRADKIQTIPLDYKNLSQLIALVLVVLGAWVGYQYYSDASQKRALAQQIALQDKTQEYGQALEQSLGRVGLSTADYQTLLQSVYDLPFFINGWALQSMECKYAACTMKWMSVGGYTDQLEAAFPVKEGYGVLINKAVPSQAVVTRNFNLPLSGPKAWRELAVKSELDNWVLKQRQVYEHSKLKIEMFAEPEIWPTGYANISPEGAVSRYRFRFKGGVSMAEAFIRAQEKSMYWDSLTMTFAAVSSAAPEIELDLQGAYYAY